MKKTIFGVVAAVAVCALVGFNVALNTKTDKLSDIALASVEATASGEGNSKYSIEWGDTCKVYDRYGYYIGDGRWGECIEKSGNGCMTGCILEGKV